MMMKPLQIGDLCIERPVILAPMAGVTDLPFRVLCREQGCGMVCTEMVSAKAITYKNKNTFLLMETVPQERPVSLQLFGSDPDIMAEAARMIADRDFDVLDVNMGCPVPKVVNNGEGSALMKQPEQLEPLQVPQAADVTLKDLAFAYGDVPIFSGLNLTAHPGDIIGIPNHGQLRIGDCLTEGEKLHFTGIPSFAPELLKSVRALDPLKSKHLGNALRQIAEEGGASVFKPVIGAEWIVGVVGVLQFEVMADRIRTEFGIPVAFEPTQYFTARWLEADDKDELKKFADANRASMATDHDGAEVFLARNAWHLNKAQEDFPKVRLNKTREQIF